MGSGNFVLAQTQSAGFHPGHLHRSADRADSIGKSAGRFPRVDQSKPTPPATSVRNRFRHELRSCRRYNGVSANRRKRRIE